jgi:hypothetical protein
MAFKVIPGKQSRGGKHIRPIRLWSFVHSEGELSIDEHMHMKDCLLCLDVFKFCVLYDTFEEVEKEFVGVQKKSA